MLKNSFRKEGEFLFKFRSYLPLLLLPLLILGIKISSNYSRSSIFIAFCIFISFLGLIIRCFVLGFTPEGTSGRNVKGQEATTLNTDGLYSLVRHPLYLGNFLIFLGILLFIKVWWIVIIGILIFWIYYERIMFAEEVFLYEKFRERFSEWAERTPAIIPNFKNFILPKSRFNIKRVIRKEFSSLFSIVLVFTFLKVLNNWFSTGKFKLESGLRIFFIIGFVIYVVVLFLKKKTKILK